MLRCLSFRMNACQYMFVRNAKKKKKINKPSNPIIYLNLSHHLLVHIPRRGPGNTPGLPSRRRDAVAFHRT